MSIHPRIAAGQGRIPPRRHHRHDRRQNPDRADLRHGVHAPDRPLGGAEGLAHQERGERTADRVTSVRLDPTPIIRAEVLEGTHVGYIVYDSFDAAYDNDLLAAIKSLKEAGITDLVLDLRNNGGGHVITSNMLSTCIGGSACQDRVYQYYRYNDERMADWKQTSETFGMSYDQTEKLFFEKFYYSNYYGVSLANYA